MNIYSQRDPAYSKVKLATSKLTIGSHGCFIACLATLYQKNPTDIIAIPGAVNSGGYVNSVMVANKYGGEAKKAVKPQDAATLPEGWCVAMTDHYKNAGYPTHFFLVNPAKKLQIDPLDYPAQADPLVYPIVEYRPFTKILFTTQQTWQEDAQEWATNNGIISTWGTADDEIMHRVAAALKNFHDRFISPPSQ